MPSLGWAGRKHSPSSSSVMAVDSNKVATPKGNWGITNRKQIACCFFSMLIKNPNRNKVDTKYRQLIQTILILFRLG